jgi:hypothetical protein
MVITLDVFETSGSATGAGIGTVGKTGGGGTGGLVFLFRLCLNQFDVEGG